MKKYSLINVILLVLFLAACTSPNPGFTVVAQGDPAEGPTIEQPRFLALLSGQSYETFVADLPGDAAQALAKALSAPEQGLYVLIYAGPQPTAGYSVVIHQITRIASAGNPRFTVQWSLQTPAGMAADVITHPWVLAFVPGSYTSVPDVRFVQSETITAKDDRLDPTVKALSTDWQLGYNGDAS
ncbi:MAG: protease complex subunit PrcB family protein [Anaerolineae bacterium]